MIRQATYIATVFVVTAVYWGLAIYVVTRSSRKTISWVFFAFGFVVSSHYVSSLFLYPRAGTYPDVTPFALRWKWATSSFGFSFYLHLVTFYFPLGWQRRRVWLLGSTSSSGFNFLGQSFSIEATAIDGTPVTTFTEPFTITIQYNDADVEGIDEASLKLYYWDSDTSQWTELSGVLDTDANTITVVLDHLTDFAAFGRSKRYVWLPLVVRSD